MSNVTLRFIIAGILCFHGIGHLMGIIPALGIIKPNETSPDWLSRWSSHSWLLSKVLGESGSRIVGGGLYAIAAIFTIVSALALLGWGVPHAQWRTLAIIAAVVSLCTVIVFWNSLMFLFPHKVGALGVDFAILVCLLALNWPTEQLIGW